MKTISFLFKMYLLATIFEIIKLIDFNFNFSGKLLESAKDRPEKRMMWTCKVWAQNRCFKSSFGDLPQDGEKLPVDSYWTFMVGLGAAFLIAVALEISNRVSSGRMLVMRPGLSIHVGPILWLPVWLSIHVGPILLYTIQRTDADWRRWSCFSVQ